MKSKFGFLSAAIVAATALLGSGEASAGGSGAWWGRAGYGALRVRELHACVDDRTDELRVAFRASDALGCYGDMAVSAVLWGDALCTLPGPAIVPVPLPVYEAPCGAGGFLPPPVLPPPLLPPPLLPPPGPITDVAYFDGFATYVEPAWRDRGNWYYADFDILPLVATVCGPGLIEDLRIGKTTIFIDGRAFVIDYDLPYCGDDWYGL